MKIKLAVSGFVLLLLISAMYNRTKQDMGTTALQAQTASAARPHDLTLLKRSDVRTACTAHSDWAIDDCQAIDQREVSIGMSAEQARLSWGKPERVHTTTTALGDREQWVYSGDAYLYVDNGVVRTVQKESR